MPRAGQIAWHFALVSLQWEAFAHPGVHGLARLLPRVSPGLSLPGCAIFKLHTVCAATTCTYLLGVFASSAVIV
eukprot:13161223-Alexandrium_andersonii.AAC.1